MVKNKIQVSPLSEADKVTIGQIAVNSNGNKNRYLFTLIILGILSLLTVKFNLFSDGLVMYMGAFALICFLGFRTSSFETKRIRKRTVPLNKYYGELKIIDKRCGDDEYEIYFEVNPTVYVPVFLMRKWKSKEVFDKIYIGDVVTFEYIHELNMFLKLNWKNLDLVQHKA